MKKKNQIEEMITVINLTCQFRDYFEIIVKTCKILSLDDLEISSILLSNLEINNGQSAMIYIS